VLLDGTAEMVFAQDELLSSTDVQPPQLARLASRLGLGQIVYTVDGFLDVYKHKKSLTTKLPDS
jgi:hypothetical protein